jgi:hypothetical protein
LTAAILEAFVKQLARPFVFLVLAVCAMSAVPAAAQPRIDVGIAYQILHAPDQTYPFGFNVDVSGAITDSLRVVGEVGLSRDSDSVLFVDGTLTALHGAGGIRYQSDTPGWASYVQFLVGVHHDSASVDVADVNLPDLSENTFMIQPGVGIKVPIAPSFAVFGQADYRRIFYEDEGENDYRFLVGVRIGK